MVFRKQIHLPEWNEYQKQRMLDYWKARAFVFDASLLGNKIYFTARRGSLWGNMTSFNMSRLITKLRINRIGTQILSELDVTTIFQSITQSNKAFWMLELDTFESWMLSSDLQEKAWQDYSKEARISFVLYTLTLGWSNIVSSAKNKEKKNKDDESHV